MPAPWRSSLILAGVQLSCSANVSELGALVVCSVSASAAPARDLQVALAVDDARYAPKPRGPHARAALTVCCACSLCRVLQGESLAFAGGSDAAAIVTLVGLRNDARSGDVRMCVVATLLAGTATAVVPCAGEVWWIDIRFPRCVAALRVAIGAVTRCARRVLRVLPDSVVPLAGSTLLIEGEELNAGLVGQCPRPRDAGPRITRRTQPPWVTPPPT